MSTYSTSTARPAINIGFIPLLDSAPIIVAHELGFDAEEGFELHIHREVSWANIRDKVNVGHFDCAHMLAPMPLAASLGIHQLREAVIAPMTLSLNGNAVTVSRELWTHMRDVAPDETLQGGLQSALALARVLEERKKAGAPQLTFGIVFPFSCQNYELRHWLKSAGIDPDQDVRLVGLPPSMMADSLAAGQLHGFCAGEPWNSVAVSEKQGCIVATKAEIWNHVPEKVLGTRLRWAETQPDLLMALIRALAKAGQWLSKPDNHEQAAAILGRESNLGRNADMLLRSLSGKLVRVADRPARFESEFVSFGDLQAIRPSRSYSAWLLGRMYDTGQLDPNMDVSYVIDAVARADLFDRAMGLDGTAAADGDARIASNVEVNPDSISAYLQKARQAASR